jgi:eukaryotic-like serine/threonine-protein kinase
MPCMGVPGRLGRYAVRRRLGSGGFATVWLAHDELLDAEVAIKVLADNWADDEGVRRRFLEEGRFLRRVESEHVVQVHDVGELEDGRPFLVLTYADRGTLAGRIREQPLDLATAVDVVVQIGRGLQALHRRGLLHRDVKPANVLFRSTDDGERAVLSDLGLGKSLDEVSRITLPGGTPSYVAPEQAMGERLDARADQYSLGAVAYAALTGRSPHQVSGLGAAGRVEAPPRPSELGAGVPDRIEDAILRALEPDRDSRWPDVAAFTKELVAGLNETTRSLETVPAATVEQARARRQDRMVTVVGTSTDETTGPLAVADQPTVQGRRRRRRTPWIVAAVLALAAGAAGGYVGQRYLADLDMVLVGDSDLGIKVPRAWTEHVSTANWHPPSGGAQPAVRAAESAESTAPGVFLGVLSGARLPAELPAHRECSQSGPTDTTEVKGQPALTKVFSRCAGSAYMLERVILEEAGKLLWIQVRADDADRVTQVADSFQYSAGQTS